MGGGGTGTATAATSRQPWPSMARDARRAQWGVMGIRHRGAVAGVAGEVSALPDLPPQIPAMGAERETGRRVAAAGASPARARTVESGRGVRGCDFRER
jgi:hypothetical protein